MSWGVVVLLESLRTAKPPVALVTLIQWSVGWGLEVMVESLWAAK
jgi:hypothetical protein